MSLKFAWSHWYCSTGRGGRLAVRSRSSGPQQRMCFLSVAQSNDVNRLDVNVDEWERRRPERSSRPGISVPRLCRHCNTLTASFVTNFHIISSSNFTQVIAELTLEFCVKNHVIEIRITLSILRVLETIQCYEYRTDSSAVKVKERVHKCWGSEHGTLTALTN